MKKILLSLILAISAVAVCHPEVNKAKKDDKDPVFKITNTNKIITNQQLKELDPKTIEKIDVYPDTVFITLKENKATPSKKTTGAKPKKKQKRTNAPKRSNGRL